MDELYIIFEGEIDQNSVNKLYDAILTTDPQKYGRVNLIFSSNGGNIYLGFFLANFIQNFHIPIRIHANNRIDSIANIIYLSAKERTAEAFARFYLHGASVSFSGYKKDFEEMVKSLRVDDERIAQYIADNTGLLVNKVKKFMEDRDSKSAQEALEYGIVQSVAHLDISSIPNLNKMYIPYIIKKDK